MYFIWKMKTAMLERPVWRCFLLDPRWYTLLKSHVTRHVITWSVVMDPMNAGSRIVNFIRDGSLRITLKYTTLVHMRSSSA